MACLDHIRNFSIIAHIDHGKSTLADRLLERTGTLSLEQITEQVLDDMELERERGITIKAHAVRMEYTAWNRQTYVLNLIDTPGHVDFSYEVSRSLAACEGALLLVDAVQGIQAQTVANFLLALENGLTIVPVINKIDLKNARIDEVKHQLVNLLGVEDDEILLVSAKYGTGVEEVLKTVVDRIPPPAGEVDAPLRALIFDSVFDPYRGVITYVRLVDGVLRPGMKIRLWSSQKEFEVDEVGILRLGREPVDLLVAGEVGYLTAGIKDLQEVRVGDTVTEAENPTPSPLPGYREVKPMVFSGLYPVDNDDHERLRRALEKLRLNDSSFSYEPEVSGALGFGFRCGFLGLLHMEVVQERLEREFDIELVATMPNVRHRITKTDGRVVFVDNPARMPHPGEVRNIEEPYVRAQVVTPVRYMDNLMRLIKEKRGVYREMEYVDPYRVILHCEFPLAEIVFDFYDRLKSLSQGYASFDYEPLGYRESDLVKLDILINGDPVDAFSVIVPRERAYERGKNICQKLKGLISRQLFEVVIQAAIGNRVIAREKIKSIRKDVTAKCYGGDVTRKRKLLEKQRRGKNRLKRVGIVDISQEAFLSILKVEG